MAKKSKEVSGRKQTSKVAMNKLKKSQNIAITLMILILIIGMCLMIFCYIYDDWNQNSGQTAEQGQPFTVNGPFGEAPVEIDIETTAKIPPSFYIISAYNFKEISPDRSVPNEQSLPEAVEQVKVSSVYTQQGKKDFSFTGDLKDDDYYVLVITNQTEGGIAFNMIYDISVYSYRPIVLPIIFPLILAMEFITFVYIFILNTRLKKVQEKVSTQRLLKAQMDMVRNFILQSSGTTQAFGMSASPYRTDSGEAVPRDGIPLAIASGEMEIVECYACKELITINSPERPLIVACPNCGVKSQVTEDDESGGETPAVKTTLPPATADVKMLPAGSPPPEAGETPTPVPTPMPTPTPTPSESE